MLENLGHNLTQPHKPMYMQSVLTLWEMEGKRTTTQMSLQPVRDGLPQAAGAGRWEEAADNSGCSIALETSYLRGCILQKFQAMPMHQTCFVGMYKPQPKKIMYEFINVNVLRQFWKVGNERQMFASMDNSFAIVTNLLSHTAFPFVFLLHSLFPLIQDISKD